MADNRVVRRGYILITALIVISLSVLLVAYMFNRATVQIPYLKTTTEREKAKLLALGGISVGMSELYSALNPEEKKQPGTPAKGVPQPSKTVLQLQALVLLINRWKQYELKESVDGIDGTIKLCLVCESGKIDLNQIYNFEKHEFISPQYKKQLQDFFVLLEKKVKARDLFKAFETHMSKRQWPLDDATELLTIKEFEIFKQQLFYEPALKKDTAPALYLTDLFTVASGKAVMQPWLLSDSICGVLGLKRAVEQDIESRKAVMGQIAKLIKESYAWPTDWDPLLGVLYGQPFRVLPKQIEQWFDTRVAAHVFSILVEATYGAVTQRLFALVDMRDVTPDKRAVKKVYWL